jgi:hypothetical protein
VSSSERRKRAATRRAAVEGVAAYLADEDADVYNITDAAVREDAMGAALNLTALAAAAVTALAEATGRTPLEALRSIDHGASRLGRSSHRLLGEWRYDRWRRLRVQRRLPRALAVPGAPVVAANAGADAQEATAEVQRPGRRLRVPRHERIG